MINHVLLIDDDEPMNFYHSLMIEESGVCNNIHVKDSAVVALDWLRDVNNPKPDLIFLDINMPIMNGWEFLEEYEKLDVSIKSNTKVVMFTTSINPNDRNKAASVSAIYQFINKPLSVNKILDVVNSLSGSVQSY